MYPKQEVRMSTGLIIAIVVIALILLALFVFVLPRARRTAKVKARERELEQRREHRAEEHRTEAAERRSEAEMAEQRARMAETEAQRERAEAEMREQRAQMHERGMADDELIEDHERDRFAGTSAMRDEPGTTRDDRAMARDDTGARAMSDQDRPMHEPATDYEQGRIDERQEQQGRFARQPETERTDDRTRST
jgi:FtsZ-interacting cell division protein ZipA